MKKRSVFVYIFVILFVIAGNYGAGSFGTGNFGSGEVPVTTTITSSGGGGAGCTYDWQCTGFYPSECPVNRIQERLCINRGTCTGTSGIPNQNQSCIYEHKEPLFDIFLTISPASKETCSGREVNANISLVNYGKVELLDAFMTYSIVDENNKLVSELKDTRSVSEENNFSISMKVPGATLPGTYKLYAQMTYSGNKTALAGESFNVINNDSCKISFNISQYLPFILIGFGFLIMFILIFVLFRKLHQHLEQKREIENKKVTKKQINREPRPERIGFFRRLSMNSERCKKERASRRLLRELERRKKRAERENILLQRIRQEEQKKQSRQQKRKQKKLEKEYKKKMRMEKKMEKGNIISEEPVKSIEKSKKKEKPFSLEEDLRKQRDI